MSMRWMQMQAAALTVGRRLQGWIARADRGQSTVEYALVGALVVIAAAAALTVLGEQINVVFGNISSTLKSAAAAVH